uniref:Chorismate lyase n=1 Tax=Asparagopsis taxiformis TaxID=260499 RepID=A0A1C9CC41_9FLOR|nr:hypothetical protein Aspa_089 [Asparagopsis taxiformis]AOM65968.1 hypothetical protein Aspa_089 [Asparagopsis taxiformis]
MYSFNQFQNLLMFSKKRIYVTNPIISYLIPMEWYLILMSDGSFTQHLYTLTDTKIKTNLIINFNNNKYINYKKLYLREIWLENSSKEKLAFAKSIWNLNNLYEIKFPLHKPIGQSFIDLKIDIHQEINQIFYGYSNNLNKKFQDQHILWGRQYTIYSKKQPLVTIEEYFSPKIIQLLY